MLRRMIACVAVMGALLTPAGGRADDLAAYVRHALEQMEYEWAGRSYERQYFLEQSNLAQGQTWTRAFTSEAQSVTFVAGCDQDCTGLSMTVFDVANGRLVDQRRGYGKSMQMTVWPGTGRRLIAVLTMEGCSTEICYFAFAAVH
ncbi:MAG: hypothetical protein ACK4Z5_04340 [Brevundimonas sp.]